jgi:hypothetical protein
MNYALSKTATMVKPTPITIPAEPIGGIPRLVDWIERVKNADREDPKLAPRYDLARDTMQRFGAGSAVVTDGEPRNHHNFCTYCVHGLLYTAPALLHDSVLGRLLGAACRGSRAVPSAGTRDSWGHG